MNLRYLVIAISLVALDAFVFVRFGWAVWTAWSGNILGRILLAILAAIELVSLAMVWSHSVHAMNRVPSEGFEGLRTPAESERANYV